MICMSIPYFFSDIIDILVEKGIYKTRSQFIRTALQNLLDVDLTFAEFLNNETIIKLIKKSHLK